jgi:hypothetical protein
LEIVEKKKVKIDSRSNCTIHQEKKATRQCDDCDAPYCNECMTEYWTHNFLSYAYLGEKKDFSKFWLCKDCVRKKRRKGVFSAVFILVSVILIPLFVLITNY